jgi:hypothetical protein
MKEKRQQQDRECEKRRTPDGIRATALTRMQKQRSFNTQSSMCVCVFERECVHARASTVQLQLGSNGARVRDVIHAKWMVDDVKSSTGLGTHAKGQIGTRYLSQCVCTPASIELHAHPQNNSIYNSPPLPLLPPLPHSDSLTLPRTLIQVDLAAEGAEEPAGGAGAADPPSTVYVQSDVTTGFPLSFFSGTQTARTVKVPGAHIRSGVSDFVRARFHDQMVSVACNAPRRDPGTQRSWELWTNEMTHTNLTT